MKTKPRGMRTGPGPNGWLMIAGILLALPLGAQAPATRPSENVQLIESTSGPALYTAYCSVCHGSDGKGGGPMAKFLKVRTPDLTGISIRNRGVFSRQRIERVISGGETLRRGHGTSEMPIWGPIFCQIAWDRDFGPVRIANLTRYIEEMQKK